MRLNGVEKVYEVLGRIYRCASKQRPSSKSPSHRSTSHRHFPSIFDITRLVASTVESTDLRLDVENLTMVAKHTARLAHV